MTEEDTFSAKQIARRIGTDAKTFRKWLRSTASPYSAVGQGQRYEFPQKDLLKIDKAFHAWRDRAGKKPLPSVNGKPKPVETKKYPGPRWFDEEREARQVTRDKEYITIDGQEPTEEQLKAMKLTAEELEYLKDFANEQVLKELED